MTVNQNQFQQSVVKGQLDLRMSPSVLSCRVKSDEAAPLVPGQAVTVVDSGGGTPEVTAATGAGDDIFGFVSYNPKQASYSAGEALEIVFGHGSVQYMEASAAVARNAEVAIVVTDQKVKTAVATERVVGRALDKASADGDLIRVIVNLPGAVL